MMRIQFRYLVVLLSIALPRLAVAQPQDEVFYYHLDAIGSVRAITDANGQVVELRDFLPFGEPWPPSAANSDPHQFTGQEHDAATGLDYFRARYYASLNGRFTRADDRGFSDPGQPQTLALYVYVQNNPLRYNDPSGHCPPSVNFCIGVIASDDALWIYESLTTLRVSAPNIDPWIPKVVNFSAGFGDGLLFGTGPYLRRRLGIDDVDQCATAYSAGGWTSFGVGVARLGYAGLAKGVSVLASSGASASAFRETMRTTLRLGLASSWRKPDLTKYATDAALRAAAGRTNPLVNAWGAGEAVAGAGVATSCGR